MVSEQPETVRKANAGCWVLALLLVGVVGVLVTLTKPLWVSHEVSFSAERKGEDVVFDLQSKNINGLLGIYVVDRDAKQLLWYVNLNYYPGPTLIYGQVPRPFISSEGNQQTPRQVFPKLNRLPVPLPVGRELVVQVEYQYDTFTANGGAIQFAVFLEPDGRIRFWATSYGWDGIDRKDLQD